MTYRQTNTQDPTEEQIANLLEYNKASIWNPEFLTKQVFAYTWYDPKLIFNSWEDFKDVVIEWILGETEIFQMWWEDDNLLGFRSFIGANVREDFSHGVVHSSMIGGPIHKIVGDQENPEWLLRTLKTDLTLIQPDSSGEIQNWCWKEFVSPVWNNNDGETLYQAMWKMQYDRAYSYQHFPALKRAFWDNRDKPSQKHDIYLNSGWSFNERKELGFDVDSEKCFIYRLIGGASLGWPSHHALYHHQNAPRPEQVQRPYIASLDSPDRPEVAPMPQ